MSGAEKLNDKSISFVYIYLYFFDFLLHTHIYIKRLTEGMTENKTQNISFLTLRGHHGDPPRMKF